MCHYTSQVFRLSEDLGHDRSKCLRAPVIRATREPVVGSRVDDNSIPRWDTKISIIRTKDS